MLFEKLRQHWADIERIGLEAEERGKRLDLKPSWADETRSRADREYICGSDRTSTIQRKTKTAN